MSVQRARDANARLILCLVYLLVTLGTFMMDSYPARADEDVHDEITVKGQTLRGRVVGFGRERLEFETIYGEGTIQIPYDSIEQIEAQSSFWVLYGDDEIVLGRLWDVEEDALLVGEKRSSAARLPVDQIKSAVSTQEYEGSWLTRMRTRYPQWKANFDLGLGLEDGAVEKALLTTGLYVERREEPTRLVFDFRYQYETQKRRNEDVDVTTKDYFRSLLTVERDIVKGFYAFALPGAERDKPRRITIRVFPSAGIGYRFFDREDVRLQIKTGLGYVYEKFEFFPNEDYLALQLGGSGEYTFRNGVELRGFVFYMPKADDWEENWLLRMEGEVNVPVYDPVGMKLRVTNINDNNPGNEVGNNKVTTTFGLSLNF